MYSFVDEKKLYKKYNTFSNIRYIETKHYDGLNCYSIVFATNNGLIFYSGDTREITQLKAIIESGENIDKIYIDVSSADFSGNPHLYIGKLNEEISSEIKNKIYCMHINDDKCFELAKNMGFKVVEVSKKYKNLSKKL